MRGDSYLEDKGINAISEWLRDVDPGVGDNRDKAAIKSGNMVQKKTSFLRIVSGPLQLGHFMKALGCILMAFVECLGVPLKNLP